MSSLINYERSTAELQDLILYAVCVAGKKADTQRVKLDDFYKHGSKYYDGSWLLPYNLIKYLNGVGLLEDCIYYSKLGQYHKLTQSFKQLAFAKFDLKTCTVEDLEGIYGIGPKTARFFLLYSRPNQQLAVLDTHILKHLKSLGYDVPKTTPTGKKYATLEQVFLQESEKAGMSPVEFDDYLWRKYSGTI